MRRVNKTRRKQMAKDIGISPTKRRICNIQRNRENYDTSDCVAVPETNQLDLKIAYDDRFLDSLLQ